jgi:hypothetical protein
VRKKEDSGGTSPARAYTAKKIKSPSPMLGSDVTPCFSLGARPGTCHPISHRTLAREPIILNREGRSSAAMAMDGGQGLKKPRGAGEQETKGMGANW